MMIDLKRPEMSSMTASAMVVGMVNCSEYPRQAAQPLEVPLGLPHAEVLGGELVDLVAKLQVLLHRVPHVDIAVVHVRGARSTQFTTLGTGRRWSSRFVRHRAGLTADARGGCWPP